MGQSFPKSQKGFRFKRLSNVSFLSKSAIAVMFAISFGASAFAAPDLVINRKDTRISAGSCATDEPIASGWIAIKNIGPDAAKLKASEVVTLRSLLAVYVPENIDMISKIKVSDSLQPFDQKGLYFELGKDVVKRGRYFSSLGPIGSQNSITTGNVSTTVYNTQRALLKLGFDPQGIDGVIGRNTRNAIRAYQASRQMRQTGVLTAAQRQKLYEEALIKQEEKPVNGATGSTKITVYAVVDPYNLIQERNEANNIEKFTLEVNCAG